VEDVKTGILKTALVLMVMVVWAAIPAGVRLEGYEDVDSGGSAVAMVPPVDTPVDYYKVKDGDSLWSIAGRSGITVETLAAVNNLTDREFIRAGQVLKLPVNCPVHLVRAGETLESIAAGYKVSVAAIADRNGLCDADMILAGQRLMIPAVTTAPAIDSRNSRWIQLAWPVSGPVTSAYGMRDGQPHEGIDIAAVEGVPIHAAGPGRVVFAGSRGTYGLAVVIDHGEGLCTLYAHCSKIMAAEGEWVEAGAIIAEVGNTGRSRGPHLHLEVRYGGTPLDPLTYLGKKNQ